MKRIIVASLILSCLFPAFAQAQSRGFHVENFEPLPNMGSNQLNVARTSVLLHLQLAAGLVFHYADSPLVQRLEDDQTREIVESRFTGEIWAGLGLFDMLEIGLMLPVVFFQSGGDLERSLFNDDRTATISDLRFTAKFRFLDSRKAYGFGGALLTTVYAPTGDDKSFNSDGIFRVEPRIALEWTHPVGVAIAANAGYLTRAERTLLGYESGDQLRWGAGLMLPSGLESLHFFGNLFGAFQTVPDGPEWGSGAGEPVEALGGLLIDFPDGVSVTLAGGAGLHGGVAAPNWRVVAAFGFSPESNDRDGDGIPDDIDRCPTEREDFDGHDDADGCPDDDRDQDGIPDDDDQCPDKREDFDGFEDEDGCPDDDNDGDGLVDRVDRCPDARGAPNSDGCPQGDADGDGVPDEEDRCPDQKEDIDQFDDHDGCPDLDDDYDSVPDTEDRCRLEPEDEDGWQDEDGCPDEDNDGDGIVDVEDDCPNEAETFNDFEDDDGCPDRKQSRVDVSANKITITEKIYFATGSGRIRDRSFGILDEVASALKANPQIKLLRIEGHTDSRGSESLNQALSQKRADAVKTYLEGRGINAAHLVARGYGESRPIAENATESGRADNRRVEFHIVQKAD